MKNYFLYVFISLFLFSLSSCKDDKDVVAVLELGLENADFYKEAGSVVIDVKSLPADWTASVDVEGEQWCKTEPVNSGAGVKISVISNPNKTVRNASVVINNGKLNKKILVRQLGTDTDILVSPFAFTLPPVGGTVAFTVTTNLTEAELDVTYPSWIKKEVDTRAATIEIPYKFTVDTHEGSSVRTEKIVIKDKNSNISAEVTVIQNGLDGYTFGDTEGIADDVQLEVVRGEASTAHGGEGIEKSFDSDMSTIYHSNYPFAEGVTSHYPVMLTYYFKENTEALDYFIYYPRISGSNGNFGEVEIQVSTEEHPAFESVTNETNFDFGSKGAGVSFSFDNTIQKPKAVRLIIKSGVNGHASCAEMKFFARNPEGFDPLTLFMDVTCSKLRSDITEEMIKACTYPFFKNIAYYMLKDKYPADFRIADFKPYQHPDIQATINKTGTYSLLDNPTGIFVKAGETLIVMVGETHGQHLSLRVQDMDTPNADGFNNSISYSLRTGINKIVSEKKGLIYVMYHVNGNPVDYDEVKIHFASGSVNGYFDVAKHTREQWGTLLNGAVDGYFDVVGNYAHLTFPVSKLKSTSNGRDLINLFDDIVYKEQIFMGLRKYNNNGGIGTDTDNRMFRNRMYFNVMYGQGDYMYSTSYHTAYHFSTMDNLCSVDQMKTNNWGPAHEVGHSNQTRPGLKWFGMTEVTNNICSMYIQKLYGINSRLLTTTPSNAYSNYYEHAMTLAFGNNDIFHAKLGDVFDKLVPFWQLELYMEYVLGKTDFYKDVYEYIRVNKDLPTDGERQIEFAYNCSKAAGLDLTDFFVKWGFLKSGSYEFNDSYGDGKVVVTEAQVSALKNRIRNLGYSVPKHKLEYICDSNLEAYINNAAVVAGTATRSGSKLSMYGWRNVAVYEVSDHAGKVIFVSPQSSFTVNTTLPEDYKVNAIAANGAKTQVTF